MNSCTFQDFTTRFDTEDACLDQIKRFRYPHGIFCIKCKRRRRFYKVKNRRAYGCMKCRWQIYPLKRTIFSKSRTPLKSWLYAMYLFSQSRCGVPAKHLQRHLGVTYKTAWRMGHKIRELMHVEPREKLTGIVEIDETYVGGNYWNNFRKHYIDGQSKEPVVGIVQQGGIAVLRHLLDGTGGRALIEPINAYVSKEARIMTDQLYGYRQLGRLGYTHQSVMHKREFRRGDVYVENMWSHLKRGIVGVYRSVSRKHLQKYVDEFAFRYNLRRNNSEIFNFLLLKI